MIIRPLKQRFIKDNVGQLCAYAQPDIPVVPPEPTLYVNHRFANTVTPGEVPPDFHTIGFGTVDSEMLPIEGLTDFWMFHSNAALEDGRNYLAYEVGVNNPDLIVGETYQLTYLTNNLVGGAGATVFALVGATDVTTAYINRTAPVGGGWTLVGVEFTPDAPGWALQVRVGTGTSANQTNSVQVKDPKLIQV